MSELYGPRHVHVAALIEWAKTANWDAWDAVWGAMREADWEAAWAAVWVALREADWDAVWDVVWDATLLVRICIVWGVLTPEQMAIVRVWLDPVAEALGKTPEELMTMGDSVSDPNDAYEAYARAQAKAADAWAAWVTAENARTEALAKAKAAYAKTLENKATDDESGREET